MNNKHFSYSKQSSSSSNKYKNINKDYTLSKQTIIILTLLNIFINTLTTYIIINYFALQRYKTSSSLAQICIHFVDSIIFLALAYPTEYQHAQLLIFILRKFIIVICQVNHQTYGIAMYCVFAIYFSHLSVLKFQTKIQKYLLATSGVIFGLFYNFNFGIKIAIAILIMHLFSKKLKSLLPHFSLLTFTLLLPIIQIHIAILAYIALIFTMYEIKNNQNNLAIAKSSHINYYIFLVTVTTFVLISNSDLQNNLIGIWFLHIILYLTVLGISNINNVYSDSFQNLGYSKTIIQFLGSQIYVKNKRDILFSQGKTRTQTMQILRQQVQNNKYDQMVSKLTGVLVFAIFYGALLINIFQFNFFTSAISNGIIMYHFMNRISVVSGLWWHIFIGFIVSILTYYGNDMFNIYFSFPEMVSLYLMNHTCYGWNNFLFFIEILMGIGCLIVMICPQKYKKLYRIMRFSIKISLPLLLGIQIWNMGCLKIDKIVGLMCLLMMIINTFRQKKIRKISQDSDQDSSSQSSDDQKRLKKKRYSNKNSDSQSDD